MSEKALRAGAHSDAPAELSADLIAVAARGEQRG
jgi:hypothetical protein